MNTLENLKKIKEYIENGDKVGIARLVTTEGFKVPRENGFTQGEKDIILVWVADCGCDIAVQRAIALGANPEFVFNEEDGETVIFRAIRSGSVKTVRSLVVKGVNMYHKNKSGYTPILLAGFLLRHCETKNTWARILIKQVLTREWRKNYAY